MARPYPPPRAADLLAHLQRRAAPLSSLRARAKASYKEGAVRVSVTVSALAQRPDRLRLAGENALAGPLMTLATDGKQFQLLDVRENRFFSGPAAPCALSRVLRVSLTPREAVEVLLGGVALPEPPAEAALSWDGRDGGREVLTLRGADGRTLVLKLDAAARIWDLREAELRDAAGRPVLRVRHEGFQAAALPPGGIAAEVRLPQTTTIEDLLGGGDLRLRWRERELNPSLPDDAFALEPPQGIPSEAAVCGS